MTAAPAAKTASPDKTPASGSTIPVVSPADGAIKPIEEVPDETFASKILGDGFAIVPASATIVAPISGTVTMVAKSKHAVGITTAEGVEVLVHIGIDTVQMGGAPFSVTVDKGQPITAGTPMVQVNWPAIKAAGKPTDVIVAFTKPAKVAALSITATGAVTAGSQVGTVIPK
ncbi:glucose PTS transporter subunit IIA [Bifidobacterium aerophilum]|uniref:PTS glucose transporter subunit IIA n=1 Tax=Bifidobacterium aerophilum TaxID=1798155 RepID=A0A6N9Z483_9BIFI|nr:PTS glucose transporter subunit IIA [Bifidobacterium aerophilum]